ncbi:MAG: chitinase [Ignavibacteria bacterium]|jgi:chitinase|nr:chitinase [Ignavibacteria bacterium]MCU7502864.1 chitinase [Ignavibacteria bacterium]MCU7515642.1 chitinase [Ignavibacteria bacterium]
MKSFPAILLLSVFIMHVPIKAQQVKEIIAYYPEWGAENLRYTVKDLEKSGAADKLTTIMYAFCYPAPDSMGNIVPMFMNAYAAYQQPYSAGMSIDSVADDSAKGQVLMGQFNQLKKLKARYPRLRVMISIGGWTGSVYFSDAALTKEAREKFVDAVIDRYILGDLPVVENGAGGKGAAKGVFDGIDIDWEYPIAGGNEGIHNNPADNDNCTEMLALFRKKLDEVRPGLLLTAAVPTASRLVHNFNVNKDQEYLDWYNVMTYDLRSSWSSVTGHHTNLFSTLSALLPDGMKESMDYAVRLFRDSLGVANKKIVPGAAFYGRGWITKDTINCGLYRQGTVAPGVHESGYNYYSDLSKLLQNDYCYRWDDLAMAPTIFDHKSKAFWTFDDPKSVALKSRYVDAYDLRGIMFWEISGDDSTGSLLNAIYRADMMVDASTVNLKAKYEGTDKVREIKITSPVSSANLTQGTSLVITTDGISNADKLIKVEFFVDNKYLGSDTNVPFSWAWFNISKGQHELSVVGTDARGRKVNSDKVIVKVE